MADENVPEEQEEVKGNIEGDTPDETTEEKEALTNSKNPERTKEYIEKIKDENKQYKSLLESLRPENPPPTVQQAYQQPINQVPNASNFQNLNQQQVNDVFQGMIDDNGYLDGQKLMTTLKDMNDRATRAEQAAQQTEANRRNDLLAQKNKDDQTMQDRVHERYPTLNPENVDQFDEKFYNQVKDRAVRLMYEKGIDDFEKAAEEVYNESYKVNKQDKVQQEDNENAKRQINATRPMSNYDEGYYKEAEEEELRQALIHGKKGAIAEALRRRDQ